MTENSFSEIKKLMKIVGGKVIIVEDGKPTMIIINADEYIGLEKKNSPKEINNSGDNLSDKKLVEKINKNINIWKNRQEERKLKQLEEESYRRIEKIEKIEESPENYEEKKEIDEEIVIEKL